MTRPAPAAGLCLAVLLAAAGCGDKPDRLAGLVAEAARVLRPGGKVLVHGLMADRPFPGGQPKLPGLAAMVARVPVQTEPADALARVRFGGMVYEKLGDIHCFRVNGVELREMRLLGWKPAAPDGGPVAYKGPFERVTCECGMAFRRGEPMTVPALVAGRLRAGPSAEHFAFPT